MTDLQVGLIIGGLVIIITIYILNIWQESRYKKTADKIFATSHPDVLLTHPKNMVRTGAEVQPSLQDLPLSENHRVDRNSDLAYHKNVTQADLNSGNSPNLEATEKIVDISKIAIFADPSSVSDEEAIIANSPVVSSAFVASPLSTDMAKKATKVDINETSVSTASGQNNFLAELEHDSTLLQDFYFMVKVQAEVPIDAAMIPIFSAAKPVYCLGLRIDKRWEAVTETSLGEYYALKFGLQLVDRQGPITQKEADAFCKIIQLFADQYHATIEFPHKSFKLVQAQELDQLCAETDIQIGLNVRIKSGNDLEKVIIFAQGANMILASPDKFHLIDQHDNILFSLVRHNRRPFNIISDTNLSLSAEEQFICFILEVPYVANGDKVFDHMCMLAQQLAKILETELVDDNQQSLTSTSFSFIRNELIQIQSKMQARGIPPGSPIAFEIYG